MSGLGLPPVHYADPRASHQFVPLQLVRYHEKTLSIVKDTFALLPYYFIQSHHASEDPRFTLPPAPPKPRLASAVAPLQCEEIAHQEDETTEIASTLKQERQTRKSRRRRVPNKKYDPTYHPSRNKKRTAHTAYLTEQEDSEPSSKKRAEKLHEKFSLEKLSTYNLLENKILNYRPFLEDIELEDELSSDQIFELAHLYVNTNSMDARSISFLNFLYRNNLLQKLSPGQIKQLMEDSRNWTKYALTEILFESDYFKNFSVLEKIGILEASSKDDVFIETHNYYNQLKDYYKNIKSAITNNAINSLKEYLNHPLFNELSVIDLNDLVLFSRQNHNNLVAQFMILHTRFEDYQMPDNIKCFFTFIKNKSAIEQSTVERMKTDLNISLEDLLEIIARMMD